MSQYIIREMEASDLNEVVQLISDTYDHAGIWSGYRFNEILPEIKYAFTRLDEYHPDHVITKYFIAEINKKIIAVAAIQRSGMSSSAFELSWGTTSPEFQNQGIGTALVVHRINWAKSTVPHGYIFVSTRAPKIFERLEFIKIIDRDDTIDALGSAFYYLKY